MEDWPLRLPLAVKRRSKKIEAEKTRTKRTPITSQPRQDTLKAPERGRRERERKDRERVRERGRKTEGETRNWRKELVERKEETRKEGIKGESNYVKDWKAKNKKESVQ